jgi:DNA-binding SARP family transcriptional activator/pimeloyl-ACP methyl ester carboxylesterase
MTIDFRILGPLEVHGDAGAVPLGAHKQRTLLAVLLLRANEVVASDQLIEVLWHTQSPKTARALLQVYVSHLRKRLGHRRIETRPPGYRLVVAPGELDADRFRCLLEEARQSEPETATVKLTEALSLWRGPPLADLAYEEFAQASIGELEELRLVALEERIEAKLALGHHARMVGELEHASADYPLRERLRILHMLALYRCGRQADALDVYRNTRRILVETLGIEPSDDLRELQRRILEQDPTLSAYAAAGVPVSPITGQQIVRQDVRFAEIDGSTLTCAISGAGPPLVIPCWWLVGVEHEFEWPSLGRFISELGQRHTIIRYNRSDPAGRALAPESLETDLRVLSGVVERLAGEPATLFGVSCGACTAVGFAASYPELVDRIVLYAPFVRGAALATPALQASLISLVRAHWGIGSNAIADLAIPDASGADKACFNELQRRGATGDEAGRWLEYVYGADVGDSLARVTAPVLVLHRNGDRVIPFAQGRAVAARVAGARFVPLTGRDHFPWVGNSAALIQRITSFLHESETAARAAGRR